MTNRLPPASEEAERALIGAVLVEPSKLMPMTAIVGSDDFFSPFNEEIWLAMLSVHSKRKTIDVLLVEDEIKSRGLKRLEPGYLLTCVNENSVFDNVEHYARVVREKAIYRRLISSCTEVVSQAYGDPGSAPEFLHESVVKISRAALSDSVVQTEAIEETTGRVIETLENSEKGIVVPRLATGIERLDAILDGGMRVGYYVVVVAQTSIGKSSLVRQVAFRGARDREVPVLLFSLEDSREDALTAGAANLSRIDNRLFAPRTPTTIPSDNRARWRTMHGALSVAGSLGHLIRIETHRHIGQIRAVAAAWRAKQKRPGLIAVDQLSWVRGVRRKGETREQEVAGISRELRDMARDTGCVVMAPSQLTDEARREGRAPGLGQTRESRAIEQDADIVLSLHRKRQALNEPCYIGVLKHRGGATGKCVVGWRGPWNGFETVDSDDEREINHDD